MITEKEQAYINEFHSIQKERNEKYMIFVKTVTTMAIGFLGIMLSLADTEKMSCMKHLFYSITITSTALGILASLTTSFGEIISLTGLRNKIRDKALKLRDGIDIEVPLSNDIKWFEMFHYIWVFSFVCALVSATLYSWF
jgi:uncharacterized membrane protein